MKMFINKMNIATDTVSIILMSIAFLITFLHIIGRYILKAPIYFSEELARYCFMWTCMLGAAIVNRNDEHTSVTYFVGLLPKRVQDVLYLFREGIILIVLVLLIKEGILLAYTMRTVLTAALGLSWAIVYAMLPVGSFLVAVTTVQLIVNKIKELCTNEKV